MSDLQFTPLDDNSISQMESQEREEKLLSEGESTFEVISATSATSQSGNAMIRVKMKVWDSNGKSGFVDDFLMAGDSSFFIKKVKGFCETIGLLDKYNSGKLSADDINSGLTGECFLIRKPYKGELQNSIKNYIKKDKITGSPTTNTDLNDDIPF